ncbi:MAG: hypothetical protein K6T65_16610, partial [Peptococcaceae bacterium]|nr:hypothetical protein [Peptococcaceae bacterium]
MDNINDHIRELINGIPKECAKPPELYKYNDIYLINIKPALSVDTTFDKKSIPIVFLLAIKGDALIGEIRSIGEKVVVLKDDQITESKTIENKHN